MTVTSERRANGPNTQTMSGVPSPAGARVRPDHAAHHGRAASRDATARRPGARTQAQTGAFMDYQQGFTSGPSN
jgi:hypothetical protein